LRSIRIDYKFPMTWPDKVTVFLKVREVPREGENAFVLDVVILSEREQRVAARCEEDIVVYDYRVGRKVPIRGFMMRAFERSWRKQEEEKGRVERRVAEVEGLVREIERGTWDREGAVEDLGGAS